MMVLVKLLMQLMLMVIAMLQFLMVQVARQLHMSHSKLAAVILLIITIMSSFKPTPMAPKQNLSMMP